MFLYLNPVKVWPVLQDTPSKTLGVSSTAGFLYSNAWEQAAFGSGPAFDWQNSHPGLLVCRTHGDVLVGRRHPLRHVPAQILRTHPDTSAVSASFLVILSCHSLLHSGTNNAQGESMNITKRMCHHGIENCLLPFDKRHPALSWSRLRMDPNDNLILNKYPSTEPKLVAHPQVLVVVGSCAHHSPLVLCYALQGATACIR